MRAHSGAGPLGPQPECAVRGCNQVPTFRALELRGLKLGLWLCKKHWSYWFNYGAVGDRDL
jgi:hypothetical protein